MNSVGANSSIVVALSAILVHDSRRYMNAPRGDYDVTSWRGGINDRW